MYAVCVAQFPRRTNMHNPNTPHHTSLCVRERTNVFLLPSYTRSTAKAIRNPKLYEGKAHGVHDGSVVQIRSTTPRSSRAPMNFTHQDRWSLLRRVYAHGDEEHGARHRREWIDAHGDECRGVEFCRESLSLSVRRLARWCRRVCPCAPRRDARARVPRRGASVARGSGRR